MSKDYERGEDYECGVEQASAIYKEVIRGYAAENVKLRELVRHLRECTRHNVCAVCEYADDACDFDYDMRKLGIEVDA